MITNHCDERKIKKGYLATYGDKHNFVLNGHLVMKDIKKRKTPFQAHIIWYYDSLKKNIWKPLVPPFTNTV